MDLKQQLRILINENGTTLSNVSKQTKVPTQTLHNLLSGTEPRSLKLVKKVVDYFEVSLNFICFGIKPEESSKIEDFGDEINAGVFEVVLRRIKK